VQSALCGGIAEDDGVRRWEVEIASGLARRIIKLIPEDQGTQVELRGPGDHGEDRRR
jgi:hypothetical protein